MEVKFVKFAILAIFINISHFVFLQNGNPQVAPQIGPSNIVVPQNNSDFPGVIDGVYSKKDVINKKRPIPYEFVRENDYIWGKRTWSYIDLREKINHPLYYPLEEIDQKTGKFQFFSQNRYSLFTVLRQAILEGDVWGFYDNKPKDYALGIINDQKDGDGFQYPCLAGPKYRSDAEGLVSDFTYDDRTELYEGVDPQTGEAMKVYWLKGSTPVNTAKGLEGEVDKFDPTIHTTDITQAAEIEPGVPFQYFYAVKKPLWFQPKDIIKYVLKEDWFFDKERSVMDVRIIGLGPVIMSKDEEGNLKERIIFWVYFPHAREVLKNYYAYDTKNTVGGNTFDHVFMSRRFNSVIYKESSLYDRKIEDYRFGTDALYESEKVKNDIRTVEHDVWNF
jgi:gliding motility associated protien GldN